MAKIKFFLAFLIFLNSCAKQDLQISNIKEIKQDQEIFTAFTEAYTAIDEGDPYFAAKKFLEAELLFPQSEWAPKSALLASYSFYLQNYYSEALENLQRYLKTYPLDKDLVYAHYLIAMCYYETIEGEKRDSRPLINARDKFNYIIKNYPNTDFSIDARFKLDLIEDIMAAKEMYLGRYYLKKEKWIAALNRFKIVIDNYNKTIFIEEALHRMVEINYKIGLENEAQKYASVLGYNYLSSEWYEKTYKINNKVYSIDSQTIIKKDKKGVFNKFKKILINNE
ncbi:outer membrane protein assembly factor BamD [Candidatus Pelagibacter sp.]|nr:outer membrane protein assembly factor BamD [Candidatus Pelagibacter sp.]